MGSVPHTSPRLAARQGALLLSIALLALNALVGCKQDEFANAPKAQAPASSGAPAPASPSAPDGLPQGHPPLDQVQGAQGAQGASAPAASLKEAPAGDGASGPLRWQAPQGWTFARPPQGSMRLGEYVIPGEQGQEPAVMSIFYFGQGGGGGVEANITRWIGQFKAPDGQIPTDARRDTKTVAGMKVYTVDVSGDFDGGMAGGGAKKAQRMLGAIVESPAGLFFFKLLGDSALIQAQEPAFAAFLDSFKPGQ